VSGIGLEDERKIGDEFDGGVSSCIDVVVDARRTVGEQPQARQAWQQALAIYEDIDHPDAGKIRAKLAATHEQAGTPPPS